MLQSQVQFSMKRYYEALDVPQSATLDQIKAQYKQLVRVYHPDRFADAAAKAQAEERFKVINEAYRALTEVAEQRNKPTAGPKPKPVVDNDVLDFGMLRHGEKRILSFQASNAGEPTVNVNYRFSSNAPWFKVAEIHPVQPDQPIPLLFKVETTLEEITDAGDYNGLIEINMDGQIAFVHLGLKLAEQKQGWQPSARKIAYIAAGLLLLVGVAGFLLFGDFIPQVLGNTAATNAGESTANLSVAAPVVEFAQSAQPSQPANAEMASQWSPIFSPDGSQIAFVSAELGSPQVYLRDPQSGKLLQLTDSPEQKSQLAWSPDSLKLAYIAGESETAQIHVVDVQSNQVQELTPVALPGVVRHFIWAEDSQSIIFDYFIGEEQRFYQAGLQQNESVLFVPPANLDMAWASDPD